MSYKLNIREMRSSNIAEINEALSTYNTAYGDNRTPDQWIWEYQSNYPDLFVFTVIEDNGRIVGTQGMIPIYINIRGKRYLSSKMESSFLNPKYRGGTLFQELYEYAGSLCNAKNMCCIWGYTSVVKVWRTKLRFSVYENSMYNSILILNLRNALSEILKSKRKRAQKNAMLLLGTLCYLYSACRIYFRFPKKIPEMKYLIEQRLRSINDLGMLYNRLREKYPNLIHIEQDEQYIMWRIYNNPNIKYKTYFVYEDVLLRGYCYVSRKEKKTASLTDFTFESPEVGAFLLQSLQGMWRKEKVGFVTFLGNAMNPLMITVFNLLKRHGFLKKRASMSFFLKNISYKDDGHLYDIRNWYAGGLWMEGYSSY